MTNENIKKKKELRNNLLTDLGLLASNCNEENNCYFKNTISKHNEKFNGNNIFGIAKNILNDMTSDNKWNPQRLNHIKRTDLLKLLLKVPPNLIHSHICQQEEISKSMKIEAIVRNHDLFDDESDEEENIGNDFGQENNIEENDYQNNIENNRDPDDDDTEIDEMTDDQNYENDLDENRYNDESIDENEDEDEDEDPENFDGSQLVDFISDNIERNPITGKFYTTKKYGRWLLEKTNEKLINMFIMRIKKYRRNLKNAEKKKIVDVVLKELENDKKLLKKYLESKTLVDLISGFSIDEESQEEYEEKNISELEKDAELYGFHMNLMDDLYGNIMDRSDSQDDLDFIQNLIKKKTNDEKKTIKKQTTETLLEYTINEKKIIEVYKKLSSLFLDENDLLKDLSYYELNYLLNKYEKEMKENMDENIMNDQDISGFYNKDIMGEIKKMMIKKKKKNKEIEKGIMYYNNDLIKKKNSITYRSTLREVKKILKNMSMGELVFTWVEINKKKNVNLDSGLKKAFISEWYDKRIPVRKRRKTKKNEKNKNIFEF